MSDITKLLPPKLPTTWLLRFKTYMGHPDQWLTVQAYDMDDAYAKGVRIGELSVLTFAYDAKELHSNTIDTQP